MNIPLGYEIGSGKRVTIPVNHTVVLGQTQLSGKTTTLEAMITRSGLRAVGFITKPGEKAFRQQRQIPPFFSESTIDDYWKYVVSIVESLMGVKLAWQERGWIVKLCQDYEDKTKAKAYKWKRPKSLAELLKNVKTALPHLRGSAEMICMQLEEYLTSVVREIGQTKFSSKLELRPGMNVMDISDQSEGLQNLEIRSTTEWIHKHGTRTVEVVPEAWKFIPEGRSTPVKLALQGFIREGATEQNYVWMDSQDLRGVDKQLLRSVGVWLFGVQRQKNEVASTLASIPDHPKPSATEVMQLGKGEFFVAFGNTLVRTYVQPAGMEDAHAQAIARGEESPDSWRQIAKALDEEEEAPGKGRSDENEETNGLAESSERQASPGEALEGGDRKDTGREREARGQAERDAAADDATGAPSETDSSPEFISEGLLPKSSTRMMYGKGREYPPPQQLQILDQEPPSKYCPACGNAEPEGHEKGCPDPREFTDVGPDGSAGASRVTSHESPVTDPEDPMWKEKYEALKRDYDALAARVRKLEPWNDLPADVSAPAGESGAEGSARDRDRALGPAAPEKLPASQYVLGDSVMEDIYRDVVRRAQKDPGILELLTRRPELRVTVERQTVEFKSDTTIGGIAMLISKGFFHTSTAPKAVIRELRRLGYAFADKSIPLRLAELTTLGFLTKEANGFQEVLGMKVHIVDGAKEKGAAAR